MTHFGLAIDAFYDEITLIKTKNGITIVTDDNIPTNPENNTAGLVVKNMKKKLKLRAVLKFKLKKEYLLDLEWVVVLDLQLLLQ